MGKPLIVYSNVPAFKEWPTNFKLLFQALIVGLGNNQEAVIIVLSWSNDNHTVKNFNTMNLISLIF